jgi:hypothetical protein
VEAKERGRGGRERERNNYGENRNQIDEPGRLNGQTAERKTNY